MKDPTFRDMELELVFEEKKDMFSEPPKLTEQKEEKREEQKILNPAPGCTSPAGSHFRRKENLKSQHEVQQKITFIYDDKEEDTSRVLYCLSEKETFNTKQKMTRDSIETWHDAPSQNVTYSVNRTSVPNKVERLKRILRKPDLFFTQRQVALGKYVVLYIDVHINIFIKCFHFCTHKYFLLVSKQNLLNMFSLTQTTFDLIYNKALKLSMLGYLMTATSRRQRIC